MKPTAVRALMRLRSGPACHDVLYRVAGSRFGARLHELREVGYLVEKRLCADPEHRHVARMYEYYLVVCDECGSPLIHRDTYATGDGVREVITCEEYRHPRNILQLAVRNA